MRPHGGRLDQLRGQLLSRMLGMLPRMLGALLAACAPLWRAVLRRRLARGKETPQSVDQKLSRALAPRPEGALVWGHAVGVGEALTLASLFEALAEQLPGHHFLITSSSRTSGQALSRGLPPRCLHQFAPIDTPTMVTRFLDHWRPALALWCEMDLWPVLISQTARRGIPMALVNARIRPDSMARRRALRPFYASLLPCFQAIYAQNEFSARSLRALGARSDAVQLAPSLKTLGRPLPCDAQQLAQWRAQLGSRLLWLGASTHRGEETLLLAAHELLRERHPQALLILAPRYPQRGAEVAALAAQGQGGLRSAGQSVQAQTAVYVADTIGEMGLWYRLAPIAFVGGSVAAVGGHNPFEALALGCAVLHGPQVWNFEESYEQLDALGLAHRVSQAQAIAQAVQAAWHKHRAGEPSAFENSALRQQALRTVARLADMALNAPPTAPARRA